MALAYTITDLPDVWPGKKTVNRIRAPFKTQWSRTEHLLERELRHLHAKNIQIALQIRGAYDLRQDGMLRADARPGPAVIVSFLDSDNQRQAYPCDRFAWWQDNIYAIAVVLEDLRRAERYGVQSSLIRAGFKQLPAPGQTTVTMTVEAAVHIISSFSAAETPLDIRTNKDSARRAVRHAMNSTHPDRNNGDRKYFDEVSTAKRVLEAHYGGAL